MVWGMSAEMKFGDDYALAVLLGVIYRCASVAAECRSGFGRERSGITDFNLLIILFSLAEGPKNHSFILCSL
jgi:hypothetical protein